MTAPTSLSSERPQATLPGRLRGTGFLCADLAGVGDFPPLAERGIAAAKRYGGIAPAVPHARHMPSHIYSMVGMWEESIASNTSAMEIQPDYYHAADFTVYAHLQLAQDVKAKALIEKAIATPPRGDRPSGFGNLDAERQEVREAKAFLARLGTKLNRPWSY